MDQQGEQYDISKGQKRSLSLKQRPAPTQGFHADEGHAGINQAGEQKQLRVGFAKGRDIFSRQRIDSRGQRHDQAIEAEIAQQLPIFGNDRRLGLRGTVARLEYSTVHGAPPSV